MIPAAAVLGELENRFKVPRPRRYKDFNYYAIQIG